MGTQKRVARPTAGTRCKICNLPAGVLKEVNDLLAANVAYRVIIERVGSRIPTDTGMISSANLSMHKNKHLLRAISSPATPRPAEKINIKEAANKVKDEVDIPSALAVIIAKGIENVIENPAIVSASALLDALKLAEKLGLFIENKTGFDEAWENLALRKRTVVLEETVFKGGEDGLDEEDDVPLLLSDSLFDGVDVIDQEPIEAKRKG